MLYCQKCYQVSPDGSMFCDKCGTSLLSNAEDMLPKPITPMTPSLPQSQTPPRLYRTHPTPAVAISYTPDKLPEGSDALSAPDAIMHPRIRLRLSTGKTFELKGKMEYLVGRRDEKEEIYPDVDLADYHGAAHGVSRRHARIIVEDTGVYIEDLQSRNETIRNGSRLLALQRYPLQHGDELKLGNAVLLVMIS